MLIAGSSQQVGGGAVGAGQSGRDDPVGDVGDLLGGGAPEAVGGDHADDREDPARDVGPAGRGVVVGGVVERLDGSSRSSAWSPPTTGKIRRAMSGPPVAESSSAAS